MQGNSAFSTPFFHHLEPAAEVVNQGFVVGHILFELRTASPELGMDDVHSLHIHSLTVGHKRLAIG